MRRPRQLALPLLGLALAAACSGDMGPGPADPSDGDRLAAEFENLAGELGDSGATASANALYHAAQVVRLVGHATPVTITIDGVRQDWLAVAEQLDYPLVECLWPVTGGSGEGDGTVGAIKEVGSVNLHPGEMLPLAGKLIALAREFLFLGKKVLMGRLPFGRRYDCG